MRHRPAGSPLALRLPEGRSLALTTGTGPGPEGSRPTVGGRRSQGCGAEEGYEGLARNNGAHREHARTKFSILQVQVGMRRGCGLRRISSGEEKRVGKGSGMKLRIAQMRDIIYLCTNAFREMGMFRGEAKELTRERR